MLELNKQPAHSVPLKTRGEGCVRPAVLVNMHSQDMDCFASFSRVREARIGATIIILLEYDPKLNCCALRRSQAFVPDMY